MKRETNRTALEKVIPLDTPFVVHIETGNTCNFKCKFCPVINENVHKKYNIKKGLITKELYEKIINDLKEFPNKVKRIYFHVAGEPLVHKDIVHFIKYAKNANVANELVMFTNGALLNRKLSEQLADAGLDIIQISVEGVNSEQYKEITGVDIDYNKFLENIGYLYSVKNKDCTMYAKILDCGLSDDDKKKFYRDFSNIADHCIIEHLLDTCPSELVDTTLGFGQTTTQEGQPLIEKLICTPIFYLLNINYDGTTCACNCDYAKQINIGNVNNQSLLEIWNGEKLRNFQKMMLLGKRKEHPYCGVCKGILNQLDDIDEYGLDLYKKL